MERCPVCGVPTVHARGRAVEAGDTAPAAVVIGFHTDTAGRDCWVAGYSVEYAEALGRIRADGGERLRLAAHP